MHIIIETPGQCPSHGASLAEFSVSDFRNLCRRAIHYFRFINNIVLLRTFSNQVYLLITQMEILSGMAQSCQGPLLTSLTLLRLRCNSSRTEEKIRYFVSSSASAFGNSSFWEFISAHALFPSTVYEDRSHNYFLCVGISEEYASSRKPSKSPLHSENSSTRFHFTWCWNWIQTKQSCHLNHITISFINQIARFHVS